MITPVQIESRRAAGYSKHLKVFESSIDKLLEDKMRRDYTLIYHFPLGTDEEVVEVIRERYNQAGWLVRVEVLEPEMVSALFITLPTILL